MSAKPTNSRVLQLKIALEDSCPVIWRRFLVEEGILLIELHNTIQCVMGWWDTHLHRFEIAQRGVLERGREEFDGVMDAFKEAMRNPKSSNHAELRTWYGSFFRPDSACPNLVNRELQHRLRYDLRWKPKPR